MPDNGITTASGTVIRSFDRGNNVQAEGTLDAPSLTATVLVATIGATAATPAFAGDSTTRRVFGIKNTGNVVVEISPIANFAYGAGFLLDPGEPMTTNYNGAIYARVLDATAPGQLRAWSEH